MLHEVFGSLSKTSGKSPLIEQNIQDPSQFLCRLSLKSAITQLSQPNSPPVTEAL